jgi:LmbE family N-acetylglucosaminyl deacetylase
MNTSKAIFFSPHPDDETLACGGTIAKKIIEGNEVFIVVMTDGRHAFSKLLGITTSPSPDKLQQIRKQELVSALGILGVPKGNLLFLDFEDGTLEESLRAAEKRVTQIIKAILPTEVYFPYAQDDHQDHRATNSIVKNSLACTGFKVKTLEFSVYTKGLRLRRAVDLLVNTFKHNVIRVDVSEFLPLKRKAIAEFKSQISIINRGQKRPILGNVERYVKTEEVFYLVP